MDPRFRSILQRLLGARQRVAGDVPNADSELLRRFVANGDQDAFELLVWRHGAMILGVCRRQLRDEHLAEDAFQAVFLVLARKARTIRTGNVAGWLYRIARRVSARASRTHVPVRELHGAIAEPAQDPLERRELLDVLDQEIARLPRRLLEPLLLCHLGGRSTEDAARELKCPRGTVLSRLSTARRILGERLRRRGIELPLIATITGSQLNGGLVSATMRGALLFSNGKCPNDPVSTLANGVIHNMTRTKVTTILSIVAVAAGLLGGVGWMNSQAEPGNPVGQSRAQAEEQPGKSKPAMVQPDKKDAERKNEALKKQLRDVEEALLEIRKRRENEMMELARRKEAIARNNGPILSSIRSLESTHKVEREALLGQLKKLADSAIIVAEKAIIRDASEREGKKQPPLKPAEEAAMFMKTFREFKGVVSPASRITLHLPA